MQLYWAVFRWRTAHAQFFFLDHQTRNHSRLVHGQDAFIVVNSHYCGKPDCRTAHESRDNAVAPCSGTTQFSPTQWLWTHVPFYERPSMEQSSTGQSQKKIMLSCGICPLKATSLWGSNWMQQQAGQSFNMVHSWVFHLLLPYFPKWCRAWTVGGDFPSQGWGCGNDNCNTLQGRHILDHWGYRDDDDAAAARATVPSAPRKRTTSPPTSPKTTRHSKARFERGRANTAAGPDSRSEVEFLTSEDFLNILT